MADARVLMCTAAFVLGLGGVAGAAETCPTGRHQTGLGIEAAGAGLTITLIDPESPAAVSGLRVGDVVEQVNATRPTSCAEWTRAIESARQHRQALLVLVRRAGGMVPLALDRTLWERPAATRPASARATPTARPTPRPEPPSVREVVQTPAPPVAAAARVSIDDVLVALGRLGRQDRLRARLGVYREDLGLVHRQLDRLAGEGGAPADVVGALRTVTRYYDGAAVAWASAEALRERDGRPSHLPTPRGAVADFFTDSEIDRTLAAFPFLAETVVREPGGGLIAGEAAGRWRPLDARALLWAHGAEELEQTRRWLARAR